MSAVFSHGRLRLYLLKMMSEGPRHGYELIRLLESRFLGLYAPSAGTIYPRLARMEADGLVAHTAVGGRKVYEITDAGRAELSNRAAELDTLESDIHDSVVGLSALAAEVKRGPTPRSRRPIDDLERHVARLLTEVRRLADSDRAGVEALRSASTVVDAARNQIRRLPR